MKQAQGFLTESGQFFATLEEAELSEASQTLFDAFTSFVGPGKRVNFERWANVLSNLKPEIRRYFDANEAYETILNARSDGDDSAGEGAEEDTADDGLGEESQGDEQLAAGGLGAVSDVGTGALAEEIRHLGEEHGAGDRGSDAQGVRGGEDLATVEATEAEEPRGRDRTAHLRGQMGPDY